MPEESFDPQPERYDTPPPFFPDDGVQATEEGELELVEVNVQGVFKTTGAGQLNYVVVLTDGPREMQIQIGPAEAASISDALEGVTNDRPQTHDLCRTVIERLGATLVRVAVDDYYNGAFYAKLFLVVENEEEELEIDARSSDAIALATRFGCPIYVADQLIDDASADRP